MPRCRGWDALLLANHQNKRTHHMAWAARRPGIGPAQATEKGNGLWRGRRFVGAVRVVWGYGHSHMVACTCMTHYVMHSFLVVLTST